MFGQIHIKDVYLTSQQERYDNLLQQFMKVYGEKPDFVGRAPGRVNLIGEHIDYEGYGVLPFAIEKDCVIAVKLVGTDTIQIRHMQPDKYPGHVISTDPHVVPQYQNVYVRYFHAGYEAALKELVNFKNLPEDQENSLKNGKFQGMKLLIGGNVPTGAGLSSSSSLCVCSSLVTLKANRLEDLRSKEEIISQVVKYQRLVGTACGGMDQSISVLGAKNSALYIEFDPIRSTVIKLPSNYRFVIMNSLQESNKIESLGRRYNKRVCQCYMAVQQMARIFKFPNLEYPSLKTFRDLQQRCGLTIQDMPLVVEQALEEKQFTRPELQQLFGPLGEFLKDIPESESVCKLDQSYDLYSAAKHVYSEAERVLRFVNICNSLLPDKIKGDQLGKLMNQSQASCKDTYRCSSGLLDQLTEMALAEGAVGSRLTGAGWGGCTVSMVQQTRVKHFVETMKQKYYGRQQFLAQVQSKGIDNLIFQTAPVEGACFVLLD